MFFNPLWLSGAPTIFTEIVQHLSKIQQVSPICNTIGSFKNPPKEKTLEFLCSKPQYLPCLKFHTHAADKVPLDAVLPLIKPCSLKYFLFSFLLQYFIHSFQAGSYLKRQFWGFWCDSSSHSSLTGDWDVMFVRGTPYGESDCFT